LSKPSWNRRIGDDRRPEFQRMIEAGTQSAVRCRRGAQLLAVSSAIELEFYVRKLAKNGVKLVSITQEWATIPCTS
jgi:DNA invertase Pin-like site-specific DNA recombinase